MPPTIDDTIEFIKRAHMGQFDKGGVEYWKHPVSVMNRLPPDASLNEKLAALLHDVLEDTEYTAQDLLTLGYPHEVVDTVKMLSRPDGMTYMDWIRSIAASGNMAAIRVKIADNEDNSDPRRIAQLPPEQRDIVMRYERSLRILRKALRNGWG